MKQKQRNLAALPCLFPASNGVLPTQTNGAGAENGVKEAEKGKKRPIEEEELASAPQAKTARRSLGSATRVEEE